MRSVSVHGLNNLQPGAKQFSGNEVNTAKRISVLPDTAPQSGQIIQLPPRAVGAEQYVISAVLAAGVLDMVRDRLETSDFTDQRHRLIFATAVEMNGEQLPVDYMTVQNRLRQHGTLEAAGGVGYITDLFLSHHSISALDYWINEVVDCSQRRAILKVTHNLNELACDPNTDAQTALAQAAASVQEISARRGAASLTGLQELTNWLVDDVNERKERQGLPGITTGFPTLDDLTGGLVPGELTLLAGRPSMGKSALMASLLLNVLKCGGAPVAVFSIETLKTKLIQRLVSQATKIPLKKLRFAGVDSSDIGRMVKVMGRFAESPPCEIFDINDGIDTPAKAKAKIVRLLKRGIQPGAIFFDHLHEMDSDREYGDERAKYTQIVKDIRDQIARPLNLPVVLLAQLSRAVESRNDKRPELRDLQESGAIEQKADNVLMVYRDEYYNRESEHRGEGEILVRKCRDGETGVVRCLFEATTGRWLDMDQSFRPGNEPKYKNHKGLQTPIQED